MVTRKPKDSENNNAAKPVIENDLTQDLPTGEAKAPKSRGGNSGIGRGVETVRARHNLSQKEFAKKIGCSLKLISSIELGIKNLSLEVALKIRERFGVSLDFLYDGFEEKEINIIDTIEKAIKFEFLGQEPDNGEERFKIVASKYFLEYIRLLDGLKPLKETGKTEVYNSAVGAIKEQHERKLQECHDKFFSSDIFVTRIDSAFNKVINEIKEECVRKLRKYDVKIVPNFEVLIANNREEV